MASSPRCPICGRFWKGGLDPLKAQASDHRVERERRHYHTPRSHLPRNQDQDGRTPSETR